MKMWTQRHEVETWKPIFRMAHDTMEGLLWCLGLGGSVVKILDCEVQPLMKKEKVKLVNLHFRPDFPVETRMALRHGVLTWGLLAAPSSRGPLGWLVFLVSFRNCRLPNWGCL